MTKFEIWVRGELKGALNAKTAAMARKAARHAGFVGWGEMQNLEVIAVEHEREGLVTRCKKAPGTVQHR